MSSKQAPKSQRRVKASARSTLRLESPDLASQPPTKKQKTKLLSSIARPPVFDLTGSQPELEQSLQGASDLKGKGKANLENARPSLSQHPLSVQDDQLWVDRYEPTTEEELAVHKRKVEDVRRWLIEAFDGGPSGKLRKYRRILALTGPAGTAKTTTVRVLARELGFDILEWRNGMDERFSPGDDSGHDPEFSETMEYEGLADKFKTFLARASSYHSVFTGPAQAAHKPAQSQSQNMPGSLGPGSTARPVSDEQPATQRQIILLEDLPNILHPPTQSAVHDAFEAFASSSASSASPIVLVISDTGLRGEDSESDGMAWKRAKETIDIRSVLPSGLLNSPYVTQINFRPIAPTLLQPALQRLLGKHFLSAKGSLPSKDVLNVIVETSNGDIRSAVMALQFACVAQGGAINVSIKGRKKGGGPTASVFVEAVTRREQSLALFHLLGKLMYNKRKGDPPSASTSAKDKQFEKQLDARLKDPPPLPLHLKEHERRTSRVDVDVLYADSPIDASLLSLYIQQNYTQYCNDIDECGAEADWLSWIDSSGGEAWYQANPHHFHLLALSTLHSLPSPVARRNQVSYKPAFFDALQRQRGAEDGLRDTQLWLQRNEESPIGSWSTRDVAIELGGVLKARDLAGTSSSTLPTTHRRFSRFDFEEVTKGLVQLTADGDVPQHVTPDEYGANSVRDDGDIQGPDSGGWLEDDTIEEF